MGFSFRSLAAVALVLPLIAWKCGPDDGDTPTDGTDASAPDGGDPGPTPGDDGGPSPSTDSGATPEGGVAEDGGADAGGEDARTDAAAEDAGEADGGGGEDAAADAATDAGNPPAGPYLVYVCGSLISSSGSVYRWRMIDSDGNRWQRNSAAGPKAGDPIPAGVTAWTAVEPAVDLPNLLAAVAAMEVSTAGYTTTSCAVTAGMNRRGQIHSAASAGDPTLVASYDNHGPLGAGGACTKIITNDPAWTELKKYSCDSDLKGTQSVPW